LTHRLGRNVMPTEVGIHDFLCCNKGKVWMPDLRLARRGGQQRVNHSDAWYEMTDRRA
jgi:hypothetical protein